MTPSSFLSPSNPPPDPLSTLLKNPKKHLTKIHPSGKMQSANWPAGGVTRGGECESHLHSRSAPTIANLCEGILKKSLFHWVARPLWSLDPRSVCRAFAGILQGPLMGHNLTCSWGQAFFLPIPTPHFLFFDILVFICQNQNTSLSGMSCLGTKVREEKYEI